MATANYTTRQSNDLVLALLHRKIPEGGLDGDEMKRWRKLQQTFDIRNLLLSNLFNDTWIEIIKQIHLEKLTLHHMDIVEIQNTFPRYRKRLEYIGKQVYNPQLTIRDVYSIHTLLPSDTIGLMGVYLINYVKAANLMKNTSNFNEIITNCLLPEWILLIFMDAYKLYRCEALNHIHLQDYCQVTCCSDLVLQQV